MNMKPSFDISLPSIPGKTIKFKIQDIKQAAFGSRKSRFNQNKKGLTKKFVQSFSNFHELKQQNMQQQTQASQSSFSRISQHSNNFNKSSNLQKFRHIIPDEKKHMIEIYETYKDYQIPILNQSKFNKGYSFAKTDREKSLIQQNQQSNEGNKSFVTDNYYFTSTLLKNNIQNDKQTHNYTKQHKKINKEKPNAIFKAQTREKVYDRIYNKQVPGPGSYHVKSQTDILLEQIKNKNKLPVQQVQKGRLEYKKLKNIISEIIKQEQKHEEYQNEQEIQISKNMDKIPQFMFIKDDRDRFGEQRFPISFKLNVPGPGAYDLKQNIEEQAKKVVLVEEQRKLLKEWFNN